MSSPQDVSAPPPCPALWLDEPSWPCVRGAHEAELPHRTYAGIEWTDQEPLAGLLGRYTEAGYLRTTPGTGVEVTPDGIRFTNPDGSAHWAPPPSPRHHIVPATGHVVPTVGEFTQILGQLFGTDPGELEGWVVLVHNERHEIGFMTSAFTAEHPAAGRAEVIEVLEEALRQVSRCPECGSLLAYSHDDDCTAGGGA